jgi:hypothetical protein
MSHSSNGVLSARHCDFQRPARPYLRRYGGKEYGRSVEAALPIERIMLRRWLERIRPKADDLKSVDQQERGLLGTPAARPLRRLAIGPAVDFPSWQWVGADMISDLQKQFSIVQFESFDSIPPCEGTIIVKNRPPLETLLKLRSRGVKTIFLPVDLYESESEIIADAPLLAACDLLLCHSEPLLDYLRPYCKRIALVEHYGKYTVPKLPSFKRNGYVLWIGGLQYSPYLLHWLRTHPVSMEVKILTDLGNRAAANRARSLARRFELLMEIGPAWVNGYEARPWTEAEQLRMMMECKAAIDIKGSDFNQLTKPPTKAQKFVSSGIPLACNPESPASRYFFKRGFNLASPLDQERWFSPEYWDETQRFATSLRNLLSIDAVGAAYSTELQSLWTS